MTPTGHRARVSASVPASIWDFPEHGSRGPRPRHNRAAIAAIAVRIADAADLEAVTMRRLASELGIAVMSLYNYVPAKEHLAQLMADYVAAEYAYPGAPVADPHAAIADLARQTRDIARRHPWLAGLLHRPMPPGPNGLRNLDYFLGLLTGSRLSTGARLEVIAMISGFATMYGAMQASPAGQLASAAEQAQALDRAAARGRYPNLAAALAAARPPRSYADIFGSCIECLIDLARLGLSPPGSSANGSGALARQWRPNVALYHDLSSTGQARSISRWCMGRRRRGTGRHALFSGRARLSAPLNPTTGCCPISRA